MSLAGMNRVLVMKIELGMVLQVDVGASAPEEEFAG